MSPPLELPTQPGDAIGDILESPESMDATSNASSSSEETDSETDSSDSDSDSDSDHEVDESLASTIVQEIDEGIYNCLVCTFEIDRHLEIWSCGNCYRVYDLECIRDWAVRGSSTSGKAWRCPSCNVEHKKLPLAFTCWCGRTSNPKADSLIPFSCGNPCNKKYPHCVHSCSSVCHPGKHPECGALGPVMRCKCGKHEQQLPCLVTPYKVGWSCEDACTTTVCSWGHKCSIGGCHTGFCGPCQKQVTVQCYCGLSSQTAKCLDIIPKPCYKDEESFVGGVRCKDVTIQYYDCKIHFEELECQPLPQHPPRCSLAPEVVKTCYCGKTEASVTRKSCTDPMPQCSNICGKVLKCGCTCRAQCHEGACVCFNKIETKCSCGNASYLVPCKAIQEGFVPKCRHKCTASLSCRKHTHREECCEFEQPALQREREVRKQVRNRTRSNFDDDILTMEPMHICTRTCNALKRCGKHHCEALCHSGPCGVCLEADNDDLVCHCGKTVVPAPVRCGTTVECREQCVRDPECGHRAEPHRCHDDSVLCPRCTKLVTKKCECGARELPNIMCSVSNVSCGSICSSKKACGHACNRACSKQCTEGIHAPEILCQSLCRTVRKNCPHMCVAKCHWAKKTSCDSLKCKEPVIVSCECGRLTKKVPCGASVASDSKIGIHFDCDEECARIIREEELREQFNVSPQQTVLPYLEDVTSVYRRQTAWCAKMEKIMRDFVSDYIDNVAAELPARKAYHFPSMSKPQRGFLHALAECLKLYSESQDKEPTRLVFICITDRTAVPAMTVKVQLDTEEEILRKKQQLEELKRSQLEDARFNAIVIQDVFFGVSKDAVSKAVDDIIFDHPVEKPHLQWIKENTFVFYDRDYTTMDKAKEDKLYMLLKSFKKSLREKLIAFDCKMCMVDDDVTCILKVDLNNVLVSTSQLDNPEVSEESGQEESLEAPVQPSLELEETPEGENLEAVKLETSELEETVGPSEQNPEVATTEVEVPKEEVETTSEGEVSEELLALGN